MLVLENEVNRKKLLAYQGVFLGGVLYRFSPMLSP